MAHGHEVEKFGCLQPLEKMLKLHILDQNLFMTRQHEEYGRAFGSERKLFRRLYFLWFMGYGL